MPFASSAAFKIISSEKFHPRQVSQALPVPIIALARKPCRVQDLADKCLFARLRLHIGDDAFGGDRAALGELFDEFVHFFKGLFSAAETVLCKLQQGGVVVPCGEPAAHKIVCIGIHDLAVDAELFGNGNSQAADLRFAGEVFADLSF